MKKLLMSLAFGASLFAAEAPKFSIINYHPEYQQVIFDIASQDPELFFVGYDHFVKSGAQSREEFLLENLGSFTFDNPNKRTRVLLYDARVAGFVTFFKTKTLSYEAICESHKAREAEIEALKKQTPIEQHGMFALPSYEQMLVGLPGLVKTAAEAKEFGKIEGLAISREFRKKGFGRALLIDAIEQLKAQSPSICTIKLDVNANNENAKKLYESLGFAPSANQSPMSKMMASIEYEKHIAR